MKNKKQEIFIFDPSKNVLSLFLKVLGYHFPDLHCKTACSIEEIPNGSFCFIHEKVLCKFHGETPGFIPIVLSEKTNIQDDISPNKLRVHLPIRTTEVTAVRRELRKKVQKKQQAVQSPPFQLYFSKERADFAQIQLTFNADFSVCSNKPSIPADIRSYFPDKRSSFAFFKAVDLAKNTEEKISFFPTIYIEYQYYHSICSIWEQESSQVYHIELSPLPDSYPEHSQITEDLSLSHFSAGTAHKLNNLLSSFSGIKELLLLELPQNRNLAEKDIVLKSFLDDMDITLNRSKELANEITRFSRLTQPACFYRADISKTVSKVLEIQKWSKGEHIIFHSPIRLHAALEELLAFLAEHSTTGEISKEAGKRNEKYEITLKTEKAVFSSQEIQTLFLPFKAEKGPGFGLGMALVRSILKQHKADLNISYTNGVLCCRIILPLFQDLQDFLSAQIR
ncbi:MAG: sensor histidine kinase [Spirochaetia bacterium]